MIANGQIETGQVIFAIPCTDYVNNAFRMEFVNDRRGENRRPLLDERKKRKDFFHSTWDGHNRYVRCPSNTWLNNLWRPTDRELAETRDVRNRRRNVELTLIQNYIPAEQVANNPFPYLCIGTTTRRVMPGRYFVGPNVDDGFSMPNGMDDRAGVKGRAEEPPFDYP